MLMAGGEHGPTGTEHGEFRTSGVRRIPYSPADRQRSSIEVTTIDRIRTRAGLAEFAALLDGPVQVEIPVTDAPEAGAPAVTDVPDAGESPYAVLSAEIALLHARLDDLQSRLDR